MAQPVIPPFTLETATAKVRADENIWKIRNPEHVVQSYIPECHWRKQTGLLQGRISSLAFLARKWQSEHEYRLIKELWGTRENRVALRFCYEWHDEAAQWFRNLRKRALGIR